MIIALVTECHIYLLWDQHLFKCYNSVLNVKAVVAAFNQEKALVGAFSVITNLCVDLRFKLYPSLCNNSVSQYQ